jgi:hypothetical protein
MRRLNQSALITIRLTPLAGCLATLFSSAAPAVVPTTWTVNSCSDADTGTGLTGTLRYGVDNAASGDIIDMSALACSTITLKAGAIPVAQNSLTVTGPGKDKLTITGNDSGTIEQYPVFYHTGTGTLTISGMTLAYGYNYSAGALAAGGCIYSAGNVDLTDVKVTNCTAYGETSANGGAVYTKGNLTMTSSGIYSSLAHAVVNYSRGGGANVRGNFTASYCTFESNYAKSPHSFGGALYLRGNASVTSSTISGNKSTKNQGGVDVIGGAAFTATFTNSTIANNHADGYSGGLYSDSSVVLQNSTIAFNTAAHSHIGSTAYFFAPGLSMRARANITLALSSSLLSNNTYGGTSENDFSQYGTGGNAVTVSGANDLIFISTSVGPTGTLQGSCPVLGPLRNNGGLTETLALYSHSPAINVGNNDASLTYDQRGSALVNGVLNYPRVSGSGADIGAYEVQQGDIVFNAGFEGCLPIPD